MKNHLRLLSQIKWEDSWGSVGEVFAGRRNNAARVDLLGRTSVWSALFKADGWQRGKGHV